MKNIFFVLSIVMLCFTVQIQTFTDTGQDVAITDTGQDVAITDTGQDVAITAVQNQMVSIPLQIEQRGVIPTNYDAFVDVGKQLARVNIYKIKNIPSNQRTSWRKV